MRLRIGIAKGGEELSPTARSVLDPIFRVPLHAEGEGRSAVDPDRLNRAVRRRCFDDETVAQAIDGLTVKRVDPDCSGIHTEDLSQYAASGYGHLVANGEAHVTLIRLWRTMIDPAFDLVDLRKEASAERDIQLLHPTTYGKQRHAALYCRPNQRQGHGVAGVIMGLCLGPWR